MRLDKLLADLGYGTRKEVKELIKKGHVLINNNIIKQQDYKINEEDVIIVDGEIVKYEKYVYYLINKPKNYLSATESTNYPVVIDLVPYQKGLYPVGRLDLETEGLLLITNDGMLGHNLLNPKKNIEKEYYFNYKGQLVNDARERCLNGININNEYITKPAYLNIINEYEGKIVITEGKYHEVKRIVKALGGEVTYLKRIRMKNLELGDLKCGEYRKLTEAELSDLRENEKI